MKGQTGLDGDVPRLVPGKCDLEDEGVPPSTCLASLLHRKCNPRSLPVVLAPASPRRGAGLFRPGASVREAVKLCDGVHKANGELSVDTDATDIHVERRGDNGKRQVTDLGLHLTEVADVVPERFAWPLLHALEGGE